MDPNRSEERRGSKRRCEDELPDLNNNSITEAELVAFYMSQPAGPSDAPTPQPPRRLARFLKPVATRLRTSSSTLPFGRRRHLSLESSESQHNQLVKRCRRLSSPICDSPVNSPVCTPLPVAYPNRRISLANRSARLSNLPRYLDVSSPISPITEEDRKQYQHDLEEINSRKFNPRKAFTYQLIDKLKPSLQRNAGSLDFRKIASTLHAGTVLYGAKVELVHNNANFISNSLKMRTVSLNTENEHVDEVNPQVRRRVRFSRSQCPLITDLTSITGTVATNTQVDPQMIQLSSLFDAGNVSSLLLATLDTDPLGGLVLDSKSFTNFDAITQPESELITVGLLPLDEVSHSTHICQSFKYFNFAHRDEPFDIKSQPGVSQPHPIPLTTTIEPVFESAPFELGTPSGDPFSFGGFADTSANIGLDPEELETDNLNGDSLLRMLPDQEPEADNRFLSSWFLKQSFSNLKRYFHLKRQKNAPQSRPPRRSRLRYEENQLVVNGLDEEAFRVPEEPLRKITFIASTLERWKRKRKVNLDGVSIHPYYELNSFFTREEPIVKRKSRIETTAYDDNSKLNLHGEMTPPLDNWERFDTDADQHEPMTITNEIVTATAPVAIDDDESQFIEPLDIDYAKEAKKLNIRRFKKTMWSIIRENQLGPPITFEALTRSLANHSKDEHSIAISFVSLLHLCNDKNIALIKPEDQVNQALDNFIIEPPRPDLAK